MIPCLIVDDSASDRAYLSEQLIQFSDIHLLQCRENVLQAEHFLSQNQEIEIIF